MNRHFLNEHRMLWSYIIQYPNSSYCPHVLYNIWLYSKRGNLNGQGRKKSRLKNYGEIVGLKPRMAFVGKALLACIAWFPGEYRTWPSSFGVGRAHGLVIWGVLIIHGIIEGMCCDVGRRNISMWFS